MYKTGRRIKDHEDLKTVVASLRALGSKIVLTQGSYDLVHIGHARYLDASKQRGDVLIVGIDSDEKIRKRKGPDRPVVPEDERLEMVLHLRSVDFVFLKNVDDPKWHLIKTVHPDILIAVEDTYSPEELKELQNYCGEVVVLERQATTSTSAKIRLMQLKTAKKLEEALTPKLLKVIQETLGAPEE
jgi:D-beta-D-heptose 7-phosphate kinase/D-beta-D-heptose 1-phosphate adenosyltransferase